MAEETRNTLKGYFQTGDTPTEQQFSNLIDSSVNKTDDSFLPITPVSLDASGGTVSPDLSLSHNFYVLIEVDTIIGAATNMVNGQSYSFFFEQGGSGGNNVQLHSSYTQPESVAPFSMPPNFGNQCLVRFFCQNGMLHTLPQVNYSE